MQLGIDFPFPFLPKPNTLPQRERLYSIPPVNPNPGLFYVNRESRQLCLEIYLPFAYTYLHPTLDTLYATSRAARVLFLIPQRARRNVYAPYYPLALLGQIAFEVDAIITGGQHGGIKGSFESYLQMMHKYGVPKRLLLVRGKRCEMLDMKITGYEELSIHDSRDRFEDGVRTVQKDENLLRIVKATLHANKRLQPWLASREPEIVVVSATRKKVVALPMDDREAESHVAVLRTAQEWLQVEQSSKADGKDQIEDKDLNPLERVEQAVTRYREKLRSG